KQSGEGAVELVAEPAAPPPDQLVHQGVLVQDDRLVEVDAEVLEWHRLLVPQVQLAQQLRAWLAGTVRREPDPLQVADGRLMIHLPSLQGPASSRSSRWETEPPTQVTVGEPDQLAL